MRAIKQTFLFLLLMTGISTVGMGSDIQLKGFDFKKNFGTGDTTLINKYAELALKYSAKGDIKDLKASIDTAEMICKKEKIEIPALLHLARAKYFYLIEDYNNSSEEASIALKLANNDDDRKTVAETMIFLGNYSLRTGFIKESIEYFNNTIAIAQKEHLIGIIPKSYRFLSNVYVTLGKTREYNKTLLKLIEASRKENDTSYLKAGYYLLGTSLTGENRNYRKADSLEFQDYKVPDSLVFRDFKRPIRF